MSKFTKLVITILFAFSGAVYADYSEQGRVSKIILENNDVVSVWLDGTDNFTCSGGARWTLQPGDPLFKEKYSLLMTAAATKASLILVNVGDVCGPWNSGKVYYIQFNP